MPGAIFAAPHMPVAEWRGLPFPTIHCDAKPGKSQKFQQRTSHHEKVVRWFCNNASAVP